MVNTKKMIWAIVAILAGIIIIVSFPNIIFYIGGGIGIILGIKELIESFKGG